MGLTAELGRLAIGAWSPGGVGGGYIAAATYSGPDTSFGAAPKLELVSVDIANSKLTVVSDVSSPERFSSLDWSAPRSQHPRGLIAGGMIDGTVRVWDAATLIHSPKSNDPNRGILFGGFSSAKKHTGAVRGLAFNPFMPTRLASGAADGNVLIWDLANPAEGAKVRYPAGKPTASDGGPLDSITAVAWNRKVRHILGSTTSGGVMSVWDLNQSKQVISIRNPRGRFPCSSLAWHPEIATQVVITCDEDESTGALMWDLRNASAPVMTYSHHSPRGVVSSSWCNFDADLLLTSSRDSRTVVVSVTTGEIVSEAPKSANWNFDVKWSPRIPGLYLSSSLDGRLAVNAMMTASTAPSVSSETVSALAESFGEMASGFHGGIGEQSSRTVEIQKVSYNVNRPPKWYRRPVGISFGFGGIRASLSSKGRESTVTVESIDESVSGLSEKSTELDSILMDLTSDDPTPALRWCEQASTAAETPRERLLWDALGLMFQTDVRRKLLSYLGFEAPPPDAGDEIAMPVYGLARSQPLAVPVRPAPNPVIEISDSKVDTAGQIDMSTNGTGGISLEGPAPWEVGDASAENALKDSILDGDDTANSGEELPSNKQNGISQVSVNSSKPKSFLEMSHEQIEDLIKNAVIVGDFNTAVDACLHADRAADALIIAHAGGPDLWLNTQAQYLTRASLSDGAGIVGAIAGPKSKMDDYIRQSAEAGKESWKESLAVILTYTPAEELLEACTTLGERLMLRNNHEAALFCFICANNTQLATSTWMRERPSYSKATSAMMADRMDRLVALVGKIRLLTAAALLAQGKREIGAVTAMDPISGSVLCEFAALLAVSGATSTAITYLSNLDGSYSCAYGSADELHRKAAEILAMADSAALASSQHVGQGDSASVDNYNATFTQPPSFGYPYEPTYTQAAGSQVAEGSQPSPGMWNAPSVPALSPVPTSQNTNVMASQQYLTPPRPSQPAAVISSPPQFPGGMPPAVPAPPMPAATLTPPPPQPPQIGYGLPPSMPADMGSGFGMMPQTLTPQTLAPRPPPPPPTDNEVPPPIPYHANARPGSGLALPPSAEVAVAETRRSKPLSSSGTPGGPPRRTNSTSSSLSALGIETVLLEKADSSKVPANQQVIVKSLRGAYMYARSRNDTPRYKKKMDDVSKRLGRLIAALNNGLLEPAVVDLLITFGQVVEKGNYDEASVAVSKLTKRHWDSNSQWIQGLKRLIDCVLTGR